MSQKQRIKEVAKILERHHKGTLPRSYYAKGGKLYPHNLLYGEWKSRCEKRDEAKDRIAWEKAQYKMKNTPVKKESEVLKKPNK